MKKLYFLSLLFLTVQFAFAQPANDDCANADLITVTTTATNHTFDINTAVLNNETICATTNDFADVWYQFTMPFNGNVYVNGSLSWNGFALYDTCGGTEIQCGTTNEFFTNLTSGTSYTLRVYRPSTTASNTSYQFFSIKAFQSATNDDCTASENITVSSTTSTVNFNIGGATINNEIGCSGGTATDYLDVWYDFTMPYNGNVYLNGSISWNNFVLYDACAGTEIQCGDTNEFFTGLTSGTNYKLRVYRTVANADNNYTSFTVKASEAATNDDCTSAENITVTTTTSTNYFEISGALINNELGCTTTADYSDIWYDFTMPINGNIYIDGTLNWNNFALYDSCGGTLINCGSDNMITEGLTSGVTYKLRVFRTLALTNNNSYKSFTIQAIVPATNDDCATSENITVTTTSSTINFDPSSASVNNELGCTTTGDYVDLWYDFTMPVNGNLHVDGTLNWNNFALYDSCGGTQIDCGNNALFFEGLTAGTTYKLRVFRTLALAFSNNYKSFTIQAFDTAVNDDCTSSENITVSTTLSTVDFEISGATVNNEEGCSGTTNNYYDIWYDFTMPVNGNLYVGGAISWNGFALYDACNGTQIDCGTGNKLFSNLTATTNYKLRVFRTVANTNNNYKSFTMQAFEVISNDDCATAETISLLANTTETVNFGIAGASVNNEEGCSGDAPLDYVDVWYDITMPQDGFLLINGGVVYNKFALYDACAGTQIDCIGSQGNFSGLTNGTAYKLRVFRTQNHASVNAYKSFTVESASTLSSATFDLESSITMYPNPTSDIINISSSNTIKNIEVFDFLGKRIIKTNQSQIDLSSFNSGLYLVKIKTDQGEITKKVIKN
ncbi:T9SS type A sorting domain-containing protein [Olleya sp. R77988]|uniref:T9SS type A sorting domain-containing protein n=1 Tax=Olleya sp. R77988 TaxID=3093875 RepID=UPI0037C9881D